MQCLQKRNVGFWHWQQVFVLVAVQRVDPTIHQEQAGIFAFQVIEKHLFVIATQKNGFWKILAEIYQEFYDTGTVRSSIHIVTEKNDPVFVCGSHMPEQFL